MLGECRRCLRSSHSPQTLEPLPCTFRYALAACDYATDPKEGIAMAQEAQRSGLSARTLTEWVKTSQAEYAREQAEAVQPV